MTQIVLLYYISNQQAIKPVSICFSETKKRSSVVCYMCERPDLNLQTLLRGGWCFCTPVQFVVESLYF